MSYQLERMPDAPIVICTMFEDYEMATEAPMFVQEFYEMAESFTESVYLIMVESGYKPNIDDILVGASLATRGEQPVFRHPKVRELLYVTPDRLSQMALKGLGNPIFGNTMVKVFETLDEALAHTRSQDG